MKKDGKSDKIVWAVPTPKNKEPTKSTLVNEIKENPKSKINKKATSQDVDHPATTNTFQPDLTPEIDGVITINEDEKEEL